MKAVVAAALVAGLFASLAIAPDSAAQPSKAPAASANGGTTEFAAGRLRFAAKDYAGALPLFPQGVRREQAAPTLRCTSASV